MKRPLQLLGVWSGPLAAVFFFIGIYPLAGLLPPLSPNTPAQELITFYADHQFRFLLGMLCMLWGAALLLPFGSALASQLQRIDSTLAKTVVATFTLIAVEITLPAWVFATIAFRPSWGAETTQAFSDLGWLIFTWPNPVIIVLVAWTGIGILLDRNQQPVFPRWVGYANLAAALLFTPSCFLVFFKTGPIAWDGVLAFWCPAVDYGMFLMLMAWATYRAIKTDLSNQPREEFVGLSTSAV
jgi:hypothetical protein